MRHEMKHPRTPLGRALARRAVHPGRGEVLAEGAQITFDLTRPAESALWPGVREAVKDALASGETHYTARTGIEPLRRAIADRSTLEGFPAGADNTVVTNGGSEALYIALQTSVSAGERVLLVEPVAPRLVDIVSFIGAVPVFTPDPASAGFDSVAALVVSVPSAISGRDISTEALVDLLEKASCHGVVAIVDRSAAPDRYEPGKPFPRPDLATEVVTVGSFSGGYGLTGWRVGYFTAPAGKMDRLAGLKEAMSISTTTPAQFAALAALEQSVELLAAARTDHIRRLEIVTDILRSTGIAWVVPEAYPGLLVDVRQAEASDVDFARRLANDASVLVEPASLFGESLAGHIRIDLRASEETLAEGVSRLAAFISKEMA